MRVQVHYDAHLPDMFLQDRENSHILLTVTVLLNLQGHFFRKNWHLCRLCWEDCKCKYLNIPTPQPQSSLGLTYKAKYGRNLGGVFKQKLNILSKTSA